MHYRLDFFNNNFMGGNVYKGSSLIWVRIVCNIILNGVAVDEAVLLHIRKFRLICSISVSE